ncbi:MAG: ABC transporter permease [Bacteroides sp.]|nr:ABC transporter permease [Bacteroides sp.]
MFIHCLKIAAWNLMKYKMQTVVSIVGLAIGFTCFALSTMWIRHEITFDTQHKDAEQLYLLAFKSPLRSNGYDVGESALVADLLKNDFPEVKEACAFAYYKEKIKREGEELIEVGELMTDTCFMQMFGTTLLEGNLDFLHNDDYVALSEKTAKQLFGSATAVIGKEIITQYDTKKNVAAVLKDLSHSNFEFGCWGNAARFSRECKQWYYISYIICIKLSKETSADEFQEKLRTSGKRPPKHRDNLLFEDVKLIPLTAYRYSMYNEERDIKFQYLILFSSVGALIIFVSLLNFLSLFLTRLRMRAKEVALRKVCGSSTLSLYGLFFCEYILLILLSGLIGMVLLEFSYPTFRSFTGVEGGIYAESLSYFGGILILALLVLLPFVHYYTKPRRSLRGEHFVLRKVSIWVQLLVGVLFIFCLAVLMKQLYYLKNTDFGWERKNLAVLTRMYPRTSFEEVYSRLNGLPYAEKVLKLCSPIFPQDGYIGLSLKEWEGNTDSLKVSVQFYYEGPETLEAYGIQMAAGEMLPSVNDGLVLINNRLPKP